MVLMGEILRLMEMLFIFNGTIGDTVTLGNLILNSTGTTELNDIAQMRSLGTNVGGTTEISADVTTGAIEGQVYNNPVTIIGDVVLTGDEIDFGDMVTGAGNLTLQPYSNSQTVLLGGLFDSSTAVLDLTESEVNFFDSTLQSIKINSNDQALTVDANGMTFQSPLILDAGTLTVDGNLQGTDNASVTLTGNTTNLNADITTVNQNITLNGTINLGNPVTLNTGTLAGDLLVNGTLEGNFDLTLETGTGNITFNQDIGNTTPLADIRVNSVNNLTTQGITVTSLTQLAGTGITTINGLLNLTGELNLTGNNFNLFKVIGIKLAINPKPQP